MTNEITDYKLNSSTVSKDRSDKITSEQSSASFILVCYYLVKGFSKELSRSAQNLKAFGNNLGQVYTDCLKDRALAYRT
jgi:hypothetical protein